jgi:molybdopterin molybdotransferase
MVFWQVAMKPGKPLAFGMVKGKPLIGLPGYPTSSMVSFEQFARPALLKMSGRTDISRMTVEAVFQDPSFTNRTGRRNMVRVIVEKSEGVFKARLSGSQKSGSLKPMTMANGLLVIPEDVEEIKAGDKVTVELFEPIMG